jgi:hypothetical protein
MKPRMINLGSPSPILAADPDKLYHFQVLADSIHEKTLCRRVQADVRAEEGWTATMVASPSAIGAFS